YAWLSKDNFAIPKQNGLVPSYPDDIVGQGPKPEPWEFVWIGTGLISCGIPQNVELVVIGPAAAVVSEIESCPGGAEMVVLPPWLGTQDRRT
ncbi:MAG: hypothetical protein O6853_02485, partial [Actinobacteria bacterium]|nr:hypothetical protein [Actinomycetota bacterium]